MRSYARVFGLAIASLLVSCQAEPGEQDDDTVISDEAPIINGSPDTTSKAVVWLYDENSGSSCTGTIIKVDGDTGYALTAAHCNNMDYVVVANDYQDCFGMGGGCEAVFQVTQQIYHPNYNQNDPGQGYDFSLIRFGGATGWPYVIPAAMGQDGLSAGVNLEIVGYGQTESGNNSLRKHKTTPLVDLDLFFLLHQSTVCFGDSGGPAIYNGAVVGVSSFVTDNACMDYGVSGRVTTVYSSFIEPFIGPPTTTTTSSSSATTGATTGSGMGGFAGDGGAASDGGAPPSLDPDDDYEWYPGKQDGQDEDGDSSSCSASPGSPGSLAGAFGLLAAAALLTARRRR